MKHQKVSAELARFRQGKANRDQLLAAMADFICDMPADEPPPPPADDDDEPVTFDHAVIVD